MCLKNTRSMLSMHTGYFIQNGDTCNVGYNNHFALTSENIIVGHHNEPMLPRCDLNSPEGEKEQPAWKCLSDSFRVNNAG